MSANRQAVPKATGMGSYSVQVDPQGTPAPPPKQAPGFPQVLATSLWAALCPCIPAAQVASAVGESYSIELMMFGVGFIGSVVAFSLSIMAISWEFHIVAILAAWPLFAVGPSVGAGAIVLIVCRLGLEAALNEDDEPTASRKTAFDLFGVTAAFYMLLMYKTARLRNKLHARATGMSSGNAYSICCPCCSLTDMASIVKSQSQTSPCSIGPVDELPPYY